VLLKNSVQLWIPENDALRFITDWQTFQSPKVLVINDEAFSSTEVAGVFTPEKMDEYTRRKNQQWKCRRFGNWHDRGEKCECVDPTVLQEREEYLKKFYKEHGYYPLP